jgi:hypothetical protein
MSVKVACCIRQLVKVIELIRNFPSVKSVWHVFVEVCGDQDQQVFPRVLLLVPLLVLAMTLEQMPLPDLEQRAIQPELRQ